MRSQQTIRVIRTKEISRRTKEMDTDVVSRPLVVEDLFKLQHQLLAVLLDSGGGQQSVIDLSHVGRQLSLLILGQLALHRLQVQLLKTVVADRIRYPPSGVDLGRLILAAP